MKYLNLLLLAAVVSVNGHEDYGPANSYGGSPTDDRDNIREASPIGRRIEESVHGDIASFHDLIQSRRQLYVSEIEVRSVGGSSFYLSSWLIVHVPLTQLLMPCYPIIYT